MLKPAEGRETEKKNILVWKARRVEITALQTSMCIFNFSIMCRTCDLSTAHRQHIWPPLLKHHLTGRHCISCCMISTWNYSFKWNLHMHPSMQRNSTESVLRIKVLDMFILTLALSIFVFVLWKEYPIQGNFHKKSSLEISYIPCISIILLFSFNSRHFETLCKLLNSFDLKVFAFSSQVYIISYKTDLTYKLQM